MQNKGSKITLRALFIPMLSLTILVIWTVLMIFAFSNKLKTVTYTLTENENPVRVLQITDLHDDFYGEGNADIFAEIEKIKPDIVVFTGDMTEPVAKRESMSLLMSTLSEKYPCYYERNR